MLRVWEATVRHQNLECCAHATRAGLHSGPPLLSCHFPLVPSLLAGTVPFRVGLLYSPHRPTFQLSQETPSLVHVGICFTHFLHGPPSSNTDNWDYPHSLYHSFPSLPNPYSTAWVDFLFLQCLLELVCLMSLYYMPSAVLRVAGNPFFWMLQLLSG